MEIGFHPDIQTYAGGLGFLAGDSLKSSADKGFPVIGVSLLYHKGYCTQQLERGWQREQYPDMEPRAHMRELPERAEIPFHDRNLR